MLFLDLFSCPKAKLQESLQGHIPGGFSAAFVLSYQNNTSQVAQVWLQEFVLRKIGTSEFILQKASINGHRSINTIKQVEPVDLLKEALQKQLLQLWRSFPRQCLFGLRGPSRFQDGFALPFPLISSLNVYPE